MSDRRRVQNRANNRSFRERLTDYDREQERSRSRRRYAERRDRQAAQAQRLLEAAERQQGDRSALLEALRQNGVRELLQRVANLAGGVRDGRAAGPAAPAPMDDSPAAEVLRDTRELVCRTVNAPRVWTAEDERKAAHRIMTEVDAGIPTAMCAVCARRRPPSDVRCVAVGDVSSLQLLDANAESTAELPRDGKTTVCFEDGGHYCLHPTMAKGSPVG